MFKKLVTNLPYSPGLLNQVGFYAKRLRQEEFTRRIGLVFAIFAMILNLNLSIFAPEASVLASPGNDVINGGIYGNTATEMQNKAINAIRSSASTAAIFDYYGITIEDIQRTNIGTLNTADPSLRSVGRMSIGRGAESCKTHQGYRFCERALHAAYNYRTKNIKALVGVRYDKITKSDPWFAIGESCGNVIIRVGKDEDLRITKALSPDQGQVVERGDVISFRIKISSANGNGAAFPGIQDTLPQHTAYVDHSPKDMFTTAKVDGRTVNLSGGNRLYGLGPNETRVITIKARVLATAPEGARLCNSVSATSLGDSAISVSEPCVTVAEEEPVPSCTSLRMLGSGGSNTVRSFEAQANADGATIQAYVFDFGDGSTETITTSDSSASINHTYVPGSYTAKVLVRTSSGSVGNNGACVVPVVVEPPAPSPSVVCDYVKLLSSSEDELTRQFELAATPENGATITSFTINYGDGNRQTIASNSANQVTAEHTYEAAGDYVVRVSVESSLGTITNNVSCRLDITLNELPEVCPYDDTLTADDENCVEPEVCPSNPALEPNDPDCGEASVFKLKTVSNQTQGIDDAHGTTASAGDVLVFTLTTENDGTAVARDFIIRDDLADVLQYANLVDYDGGILSDDGLSVTWPVIDIKPGEVIERTITVKVKSPIPDTPVSASDPLAFDLRMENAYGNNVSVELPPSIPKLVEGTATSLPNTGPGLNASVSTLFIGMVSFFYFRNRLISKELRMIRNEFTGGGLS